MSYPVNGGEVAVSNAANSNCEILTAVIIPNIHRVLWYNSGMKNTTEGKPMGLNKPDKNGGRAFRSGPATSTNHSQCS